MSRTSRVGGNPAWYNALTDPFDHEPVAIPDSATAQSVKYSSRQTFTVVPTASVTTGTSHGASVGIMPYLWSQTSQPSGTSGEAPTWIGIRGASVVDEDGFTFPPQDPASPDDTLPPNFPAMFPPVKVSTSQSTDRRYLYRCTAMGVRVTPLVEEFHRAGQIEALQVLGVRDGDQLCDEVCYPHGLAFATSAGTVTVTDSSMRESAKRVATSRNPDGSFEAHWLPSGVPKYVHLFDYQSQVEDHIDEATPILFVNILGDKTESSSPTGNQYRFDVVAHWEVLPCSLYALVTQPTLSLSDPIALAACLNALECAPSALRNGLPVADGRAHVGGGSAYEAKNPRVSRPAATPSPAPMPTTIFQGVSESVLEAIAGAIQDPAMRDAVIGYVLGR